MRGRMHITVVFVGFHEYDLIVGQEQGTAVLVDGQFFYVDGGETLFLVPGLTQGVEESVFLFLAMGSLRVSSPAIPSSSCWVSGVASGTGISLKWALN